MICVFQAELKERISEVDDDSVDSPEPPPPVPRRMVGVVRPTSVASEAVDNFISRMVAIPCPSLQSAKRFALSLCP